MRAYELMIIFDAALDESAVQNYLNRIEAQASQSGGTVERADKWGVRRFAYEMKHRWEGFYVVLEVLAPTSLDELDRNLRLADEVLRHKFMRLPVPEAHRRGLAAATA